ncbi:LysR family transcriptional regulator [Burkholderia cenocepacia]|nr:LysR family transcriptional regulator [Burkholderia cenocepacia]
MGSFTVAAKSLGIPLPTVSRKMLELERDLKTQLFDRTTRGCAVTDAGARLLAQIGPGVEMLNEFENTAQLDSTQLTGRLRLSLPQSFGPWWELLGMFQRLNPGIRVSIYSTERRVDLLSDGIDVALRVGAISDESVVTRHLGDFRHILVGSPSLVTGTARVTEPADISKLPCAAWGSTIDEQPVWKLGTSSVSINASLIVNDYLHLRDRALAGDFLTELPFFLAAKDLREGRLVEVLPDHPFPSSSLHLVYRRLRYPLAIVRSYVDFCTTNFPHFLDAWNAAKVPTSLVPKID